MKNLIVLCAALALVAGCKKKNPSDNANPSDKGSNGAGMTPTANGGSGSGASSGSGADTANADTANAANDPKVQRGAYIVKAAGCLVCHTGMGPTGPDLANPGAGGLEMPDAIGTWRTPNITMDKGTGLGNWTDDQIIAAIRQGVRPDGRKLYPIMPYMNYNGMTDDDAHALVAFLKTLKPVERTVAPNKDLKMAPIDAPPPSNKAPGADPVEQGQYLASIMLCSHCHWTPKKDMSGPVDMNHMFSGGLPLQFPPMGTGTLFSANITSDPDTGIGKYTEDQIFTTLKTMVRPNGKPIMGPMLILQGGWSQLEEKDLRNVVAFIKKLPPIKNKVPPSTFKPNGPPPAGGPPAAGSDSSGSAAGSAGATSAATGSAAAGSAAAGSGATGAAPAAGSAATK